MDYNPDKIHESLKKDGYVQKELKPWNVRPNDIYLMSDSSRFPMSTMYIPVVVTITDKYGQFYREHWNPNAPTARTAYRFYHKPVNSDDLRFLYDRHKTEGWNRFDTVEIWRKKETKS